MKLSCENLAGSHRTSSTVAIRISTARSRLSIRNTRSTEIESRTGEFLFKKTIRTGYRWPTGEVGRRERAPKGQCTRSRRLPHSLRPSAAIALPLFITSFLSWDNIGGEEVKSYYPARTAVASLISLLNMASLLLVILLRNFPYEMRSRNRKVAGLPLFFLLSECVCLCVRRPVGGTAGRINDPDRSRFHFQ